MIPLPVISLPLVGDHDDGTGEYIPAPAELSFPSEPIRVEIVQQEMPFFNTAQYGHNAVQSWAQYVGQEALKKLLRVYIADAQERGVALPHVMLASGMPGVGKTTLAQLLAQEMGSRLIKLDGGAITRQTLIDAVLQMNDFDVLFIDEIHKLAAHGPAMAENLLHLMEEKMLYLTDGPHELTDFTLIGATTDADKLPEAIIHRFPIRPETGAYFQKYTLKELVRITRNFCLDLDLTLDARVMVAIAKACRGTPRVARDLVVAAQALQNAQGSYTPKELLDFVQLEPDGTTRQHIAYLTAMFQFFGREKPVYGTNDTEWEYVAGEASLMNVLRENKPGLARIERFLIENGLVDRTPRGRRLTDRGIERARGFIARGLGLNSG